MERIDDLYINSFRIYQDDSAFCFGTDAVLLYGMMPEDCGRTVDLCSGNGAVALMLLAGKKAERVTAVELQKKGCALMQKSALLNGCEDTLKIVCGDICKIKEILLIHSFDTVCVNPPYFKKGSGLLPDDHGVATARHELYCTIDDVFSAAAFLLREGGDLYMVHRRAREKEILSKINKYDLYPYEIRRVFSTPSKAGELILIHAKKAVRTDAVKQSTFTVLNEDRSLSEAYKSIYGGK